MLEHPHSNECLIIIRSIYAIATTYRYIPNIPMRMVCQQGILFSDRFLVRFMSSSERGYVFIHGIDTLYDVKPDNLFLLVCKILSWNSHDTLLHLQSIVKIDLSLSTVCYSLNIVCCSICIRTIVSECREAHDGHEASQLTR